MSDRTEICTLVSIKLTGWQGRRKVSSIGDELTENKGAAKDAADVFVNLVSKEFLAPIQVIDREIRSQFYALTFDTGITGVRALPYNVQAMLNETLAKLFSERKLAIADMIVGYSTERERRAVSMGRLFNADHYPEPLAIDASFTANLSFIPMPAAWKLGIEDDKVKQSVNDTRDDILKSTDNDAWSRVRGAARDALERLSRFVPATDTDKAQHHFGPSLISAMQTLVDNMSKMYLGNDPAMKEALTVLQDYIANADLDTLKTDQGAREEAITAMKSVIGHTVAEPVAEPKPGPVKLTETKLSDFKCAQPGEIAKGAPVEVIGLYDDLLD